MFRSIITTDEKKLLTLKTNDKDESQIINFVDENILWQQIKDSYTKVTKKLKIEVTDENQSTLLDINNNLTTNENGKVTLLHLLKVLTSIITVDPTIENGLKMNQEEVKREIIKLTQLSIECTPGLINGVNEIIQSINFYLTPLTLDIRMSIIICNALKEHLAIKANKIASRLPFHRLANMQHIETNIAKFLFRYNLIKKQELPSDWQARNFEFDMETLYWVMNYFSNPNQQFKTIFKEYYEKTIVHIDYEGGFQSYTAFENIYNRFISAIGNAFKLKENGSISLLLGSIQHRNWMKSHRYYEQYPEQKKQLLVLSKNLKVFYEDQKSRYYKYKIEGPIGELIELDHIVLQTEHPTIKLEKQYYLSHYDPLKMAFIIQAEPTDFNPNLDDNCPLICSPETLSKIPSKILLSDKDIELNHSQSAWDYILSTIPFGDFSKRNTKQYQIKRLFTIFQVLNNASTQDQHLTFTQSDYRVLMNYDKELIENLTNFFIFVYEMISNSGHNQNNTIHEGFFRSSILDNMLLCHSKKNLFLLIRHLAKNPNRYSSRYLITFAQCIILLHPQQLNLYLNELDKVFNNAKDTTLDMLFIIINGCRLDYKDQFLLMSLIQQINTCNQDDISNHLLVTLSQKILKYTDLACTQRPRMINSEIIKTFKETIKRSYFSHRGLSLLSKISEQQWPAQKKLPRDASLFFRKITMKALYIKRPELFDFKLTNMTDKDDFLLLKVGTPIVLGYFLAFLLLNSLVFLHASLFALQLVIGYTLFEHLFQYRKIYQIDIDPSQRPYSASKIFVSKQDFSLFNNPRIKPMMDEIDEFVDGISNKS